MSNLAGLNIKIDRTVKTRFKVRTIPNESMQFHNLLDDMRDVAEANGFMNEDEINAEIQAARKEIKTKVQA